MKEVVSEAMKKVVSEVVKRVVSDVVEEAMKEVVKVQRCLFDGYAIFPITASTAF